MLAGVNGDEELRKKTLKLIEQERKKKLVRAIQGM